MKIELPGTPLWKVFSISDFSGCEFEIKFFGGPYGNRKICIVCGKAWFTPGVLWSAEVLHFAVDGAISRENSKRHDLVFQIHSNAFGKIAV